MFVKVQQVWVKSVSVIHCRSSYHHFTVQDEMFRCVLFGELTV